jgi:uncharacterized RDD family membrane protein YckC
MVTGFDLVGKNRTLHVHWAKRIVAFVVDGFFVLLPLWIAFELLGVGEPLLFGLVSGLIFFAYGAVFEAVVRATPGKYLFDLEVRSVRGPVTLGATAMRNLPKFFWYIFPVLDALLGLATEGDPRQRLSDRVFGTYVAQTNLLRVKVQRIETAHAHVRGEPCRSCGAFLPGARTELRRCRSCGAIQ